MSEEEVIKQQLEEKFPELKDKISVKKQGCIFADSPSDRFKEILLYSVKQIQFDALSAITALDSQNSLEVLYHLNKQGRIMLNLRLNLDKSDPCLDTVTGIFVQADIYEREIMDLFGIKVKGLLPGHRYPLPDSWPKDVFPLRKEYKRLP